MTVPSPRPEPRRAAPELLVLQRAERLAADLMQRSARWPKSLRHSLTRRLEDHVLAVVDDLVTCRYRTDARAERLRDVNLRLERARRLLRLANQVGLCGLHHYELLARGLDEVGRMLHGWRERLARSAP
jgi:predicted transcriptional regulator